FIATSASAGTVFLLSLPVGKRTFLGRLICMANSSSNSKKGKPVATGTTAGGAAIGGTGASNTDTVFHLNFAQETF
ncbi:hypothetical protein RUND412_008113, partial [Rhizina undulata]